MQILLDATFGTVEQLSQAVSHWDLDFRLMDTGGFAGRIRQLVSSDVLFSYARFEKALNQAGSTPTGYKTFVLPGYGCQGFWWRGHPVSRDNLLIFPDSNELQASSTADFEVLTISLRQPYLENCLEQLGLPASCTRLPEVIALEPKKAARLRRQARDLIRRTDMNALDNLADSFSQALLVCAFGEHDTVERSSRKSDLAVGRVIAYASGIDAPSTQLSLLCDIAGVSERTLQYAFVERYGVSPSTFVKRWNLNTARRQLLNSLSNDTTVREVALRLGFSHLGQFASDYRQLFNEPPSRTMDGRP